MTKVSRRGEWCLAEGLFKNKNKTANYYTETMVNCLKNWVIFILQFSSFVG